MQDSHNVACEGNSQCAPSPNRPPFYAWLRSRSLSIQAAARQIRLSGNTLNANLLPVTSPRYREATVETRLRVEAFTRGDIKLADWPRKAVQP